jgi:hypothetical protein
MLVRFLKRLVPNKVKHNIATRLLGDEQYKFKVEQVAIKSQVDQELSSYINEFVPRVITTTKVESIAPALDRSEEEQQKVDLQFRNFWQEYQKRHNENDAHIGKMQQEYPISSSLAGHVCNYYKASEQIDHNIAQVMKRSAYIAVPFYNSPKAVELHRYREKLAKIGLVSHPNHEPKDFLFNSINGLATAEHIDPEMIISHTWAKRPYDYLRFLKEKVQNSLSIMPETFFERFGGRDWFVEQLAYRAQCEIGLQQLLEQNRWQALITGDVSSPLSLALMDTPRHKRPPIIYFPHGSPYGNAISAMFLKADYMFARGKRDKNFMIDMGFAPANIIKVGSLVHESFPSNDSLEKQRQAARRQCFLSNDIPILVLSVTWDPYLYTSRSSLEVQELIIQSLALVAQQMPNKKPVLYLKYHPYPVNDPSFSVSRLQFPLHNFLKLVPLGYSLRLADTFDDCLPAADCFIGQESTVLSDAMTMGVPTISLDYASPTGRPTLDYDTYKEPAVHKLLSVYDSPDTISDTIIGLLAKPRIDIYNRCRTDWSNVFDCGRSEGIARTSEFFRNLLDNVQGSC